MTSTAPLMNYIAQLEKDMILIEGDTFQMKSENWSGEKLERKVQIADFYLCKYPVTQGLWQAVMGGNPSYFKGANRPVERVRWYDTQVFLEKLNQQSGVKYRLPSEAEWQYAAQGGKYSKGFVYAGGNKLKEVGWYDENSHRETMPVGLKRPNELGLYDMSGNVQEWCADVWHDNYDHAPTHGSAWVTGSEQDRRVNRGGFWNFSEVSCRVSYRHWSFTTLIYNHFGFRLARY